MPEPSSTSLRRQRSRLLKRLPPLQQLLHGSLIERYKRCGKAGCKCAQGRGHGPKYYLSISKYKVRPQMDYVPLRYHQRVRQYLQNYGQVQELLKEVCAINRELLRRRERL